jgi:RNA polymerase sigma-70 factor (ECF subfamily)
VSIEARLQPKRRAGARPAIEAVHFRDHERFLWGLSYRLTGNAADADDIVQETFLRAMERPPADTTEPWRPWLVRVAVNLGRDTLRRRRKSYVGPWLPSPVELDEPPSWEIAGEGGTEGRYDLLESASFAFLLALEALTPQQRAVLLLRDVFDYSVQETAAALGLSEPNVKTTHHRARRALEGYDRARMRPSPALVERSRDALVRLLKTVATFDVAAVEALLAEDARAMSDGGGELLAARVPVVGRKRVAKLLVGLAQHSPRVVGYEVRLLNGLPALVMELAPERERVAKRYVLRCEIDAAGLVTGVHTVLATRKLTRVRPATLGFGASPRTLSTPRS